MYQQLSSSHFNHIAAIIPCYTTAGDTTAIINTTGDHNTFNTRIRTVLHRLARSRATDLAALKQRVAQATEHAIFQPLPLAPGLVLCPIKVRTPCVSGDTSTGYINLHAVTGVTANHNSPYQSTIQLTGGTELPSLWKPSTVKKHLQYARLALSYTTGHDVLRPELLPLSHKLLELFADLLSLKHLFRHTPK